MDCVSIFQAGYDKGQGYIKIGLLDFAVKKSTNAIAGQAAKVTSYIVTAAGTVEAHEIETVPGAVDFEAMHLWSLSVDLYGTAAAAAPKEAEWPATIAVNSKFLLVQSEHLWVYTLDAANIASIPSGGREITGLGSLCIIQYSQYPGCGQVAFGIENSFGFSLTGSGDVYRIDLEDQDSTPTKLASITYGDMAYGGGGMVVEPSQTDDDFLTYIYVSMETGYGTCRPLFKTLPYWVHCRDEDHREFQRRRGFIEDTGQPGGAIHRVRSCAEPTIL